MDNLQNTLTGTIIGHLPEHSTKRKTSPPQDTSTKKHRQESSQTTQQEDSNQTPIPTQPPGHPISPKPTTKKVTIQPTGMDWNDPDEIDSNVLDLVTYSPSSQGYSIIPRLIGNNATKTNNSTNSLKITKLNTTNNTQDVNNSEQYE